MAKRAWGPGNPLYEWKKRHGQLKGRRKSGSAPMARRRSVRRYVGRRKAHRSGKSIPLVRTATRAMLAFRALVGGPTNAQKLLAGDLTGWWNYQKTVIGDSKMIINPVHMATKTCKNEVVAEIIAEVAGRYVPRALNPTFKFAGRKWRVI